MSTLAVVEEILRETAVPMSVREIVERAGVRLPSKSKTPDTVVARDLSMDIKKKGEGSLFIRTSPGRYTLRALVTINGTVNATGTVTGTASTATVVATTPDASVMRAPAPAPTPAAPPQSMSALAQQRKPAVPAAPTTPRARTDSEAQGGGLAG